MPVLRTPDERFENLPGFPFAPQYVELDGLRMHYVDEGPRDAMATVLCLHGQPTWSYLYRKMIPVFTGAALRVVAPDWFGFGRSDKPVDDAWYTFDVHRRSALQFIERLDLQESREAAAFWKDAWRGDSFMAIGMQDPVLGPPVMRSMRRLIRACPAPLEVAEGGHFVQEHGQPIAAAALRHFGLA